MGMPAQQTEWTAEMARTLPDDGKRYEVLDGELFVTSAPSWDHQHAVESLILLLDPYVRANSLGYVRTSPADVEFSPRVAARHRFVLRRRRSPLARFHIAELDKKHPPTRAVLCRLQEIHQTHKP